jgi:hypothetical protein
MLRRPRVSVIMAFFEDILPGQPLKCGDGLRLLTPQYSLG